MLNISFRDLMNLIAETDLSAEEIRMLSNIPDTIAEYLQSHQTGKYPLTPELVTTFNGNIFEFPTYDTADTTEYIDSDYFEIIYRAYLIAFPTLLHYYYMTSIKYTKSTDVTIIKWKKWEMVR